MLRTLIAIPAFLFCIVLSLPAVLCTLPLLIIARSIQAFAAFLEPAQTSWQQLIEFHPTIGWRPRRNINAYCLEPLDDVFHVETDGAGWPKTAHWDDSDIVVFGDSFAFGYGADLRDTFAFKVQNAAVKLIGAPGYNLVQELQLIEEYSEHIRNKLVVWFVYTGNDLYGNLAPEMNGYRTPYVHNQHGDWEIVTDHLSRRKWTASQNGTYSNTLFVQLHTPSAYAARAYDACEYLLHRGNEICNENNARLAVVLIPTAVSLDSRRTERLRSERKEFHSFDPQFAVNRLSEICDKLCIDCVSLTQHLTVDSYKQIDGHWTTSGHRTVGRVLSTMYSAYCSEHRERIPDVNTTQVA